MFGLLIKDVDFFWTEQCQISFETLKAKLSMALVLRGPNCTLPFHISTDASNTAIGGLLGKKIGPTALCHLFCEQELVPCRVKLYGYQEIILGSCSCY
jgi:hypothetical protein